MNNPLSRQIVIATLLSGLISGLSFLIVPGAQLVVPGLLFGLATGLVFKGAKRFNNVQGFL